MLGEPSEASQATSRVADDDLDRVLELVAQVIDHRDQVLDVVRQVAHRPRPGRFAVRSEVEAE